MQNYLPNLPTNIKDVFAKVGASRPVRDSIDTWLIRQVRTNSGKMIDSQNEIGGWPVYASVKPRIDSDADCNIFVSLSINDHWVTEA